MNKEFLNQNETNGWKKDAIKPDFFQLIMKMSVMNTKFKYIRWSEVPTNNYIQLIAFRYQEKSTINCIFYTDFSAN